MSSLHELIKTDNLCKSYNNKVALQNLNLSIKSSEIFTLLGPNGAGKSSTINILTGFLEPSKGNYLIEN